MPKHTDEDNTDVEFDAMQTAESKLAVDEFFDKNEEELDLPASYKSGETESK